jgi:thioredoxin 1
MKRQIVLLLILVVVFSLFVFAQSKKLPKRIKPVLVAKDTNTIVSKPLITFIELGSVKCIPCKAMQPVMKAIEEKYGAQIKVETGTGALCTGIQNPINPYSSLPRRKRQGANAP